MTNETQKNKPFYIDKEKRKAGSLIGAAANVMVAGLGDRAGYPLNFLDFIKIGLPIMLFSVLGAHVYIYLVYF
ncbi:hypothetical protein [Desulfobacter sp.]